MVTAEGLLVNIDDGFGWGTVMTLAEDLRVKSFERSDLYWQVHQDLEQEGRLTHSADECADRIGPVAVRTWAPANGWSTVPVPIRLSIAVEADGQ
jgi:hypothetical protein